MSSQPEAITDEIELQWRLVYSVIVAGKTAAFAENATRRLFFGREFDEPPFEFLRRFIPDNGLSLLVRDAKTGNYRKTAKSLEQMATAGLDLRTCTAVQLEGIHGIGPKTARFFLIWTRPLERCAALDVHVLRWLRANGYADAPKATPSSRKQYRRFEEAFLNEADRRGLTPRQLDSQIWAAGSGRDD